MNKKKILLATTDPLNSIGFKEGIEARTDFEVLVANDFCAAMNIIKNHVLEIVLTDLGIKFVGSGYLMKDEKNGIELPTGISIKNNATLKNTPTLFFDETISGLEKDKLLAADIIKTDEIIELPILPSNLVDKIVDRINLVEGFCMNKCDCSDISTGSKFCQKRAKKVFLN